MITKEIAVGLRVGQTLYHANLKNKDGSAVRCRVNGKCKVWKTLPGFRLPVKHGLRDCFYITPKNGSEWITVDQIWGVDDNRLLARVSLGLADDVPDAILRDRMIDGGLSSRLEECGFDPE